VNSNTATQYNFSDTITAPILYYRLKIIAASGNISYSNVLLFKDSSAIQNNITLLRNPLINNNIQFKITSIAADKLILFVTGMDGKKILEQQITVAPGINQLAIPLPPGMAKGIYTVQASTGFSKKTFRVLYTGK
jgi:anaerobic C4-dicarboxylate transporter